MKRINFLMAQKEKSPRLKIDDKTIFFIFQKIIKEEYGNQGIKNLKASFLKNKKLFVKTESSVWANEMLLNKKNIIQKINQEIGREEISEIKKIN